MDTIVEATQKQTEAIQRAINGENLFITGKAGTGKSWTVMQIIKQLKESKKRIACVAPTGIAANNIDGVTIHSLFKIPPFGIIEFKDVRIIKNREILSRADTFIIDEVSMLRPDILDAMHWTLKKNGISGGLHKKQVIFVGDMKQLPVVLTDNERSVLYTNYKGDTFEYAKVLEKLDYGTIELDEVMRQSDTEFIEHLNIIREGGKSEYFRQFVSDNPNGIILAPHNSTVQEYNKKGLQDQKGELLTFDATITGKAKASDFHLEEQIKVKDGCKIMYLVNSQDNPLRNGTLGVLVVKDDNLFIKVGSVDYKLSRIELTKKQYVYDKDKDELILEEIGTIVQYPIKLAYALSIHKAQGLTFDEVTIDLKRPCFQKGQMYVALSRVKSPKGLRIII